MNWGLFMKTKIIYISGSEVFQMSDVRAAFDTVRSELGLGSDTVLFGVPVDADDALGGKFENAESSVVNAVSESPAVDAECPVMDTPIVVQDDSEQNVMPAPKRTRKKAVAKVQEVVETEPEIATDTQPEPAENNDGVISILSVLGGVDAAHETVTESDDDDQGIDLSLDVPDDISENNEPVVNFDAADIDDEIPTIEPQVATIDNSDDADDSLEKLLQSVQSLHEDKDETVPEPTDAEPQMDETDLTLEKLANEFAENQDKIVNTTKSSARGGKIGKLKNILPFKKVKHNESSLMGDLFGWAGVAANDEEFGIPEFFPTAAKK